MLYEIQKIIAGVVVLVLGARLAWCEFRYRSGRSGR